MTACFQDNLLRVRALVFVFTDKSTNQAAAIIGFRTDTIYPLKTYAEGAIKRGFDPKVICPLNARYVEVLRRPSKPKETARSGPQRPGHREHSRKVHYSP